MDDDPRSCVRNHSRRGHSFAPALHWIGIPVLVWVGSAHHRLRICSDQSAVDLVSVGEQPGTAVIRWLLPIQRWALNAQAPILQRSSRLRYHQTMGWRGIALRYREVCTRWWNRVQLVWQPLTLLQTSRHRRYRKRYLLSWPALARSQMRFPPKQE